MAHEAGSLVTSDVETVKALLSIAAQARQFRTPLPFVVAEIQDIRKHPVIERAYPGAIWVRARWRKIRSGIIRTVSRPSVADR